MTEGLYRRRRTPFSLFEIRVLEANDEQLLEISRELGIALNLQEMKKVKSHFTKMRRNPTDVELQTIGQTWSEHCYHKTFKGKIRFRGKIIDGLFKTYIAKATQKINPRWCFSVFEENAGIVTFDKGYGIAVKVETHNHPSAIEPFGGAATGVGGVIRDILGVWADPIACTDVLGFGPLDFRYEKLPPSVKHPKYLYRGVVAGIGNYGNNMGIPTVDGAIYFDETYTGNVIVYCGCIGLLPLSRFRRNGKPNDLIVLAGGKTGRDGIHGVTFASVELTENSEKISRPAVQIANPIEEEKVKRAVVDIRDSRLASSITDLGGGGLSSAVGETAKKFDCGAIVNLDKIPVKQSGLAPWEIYVSESQERMLLTVPPENLGQVLQIFQKEDVEAVAIGNLTAERKLALEYHKQNVADIAISFLFEPPIATRIAEQILVDSIEPAVAEPVNLNSTLLQVLSSPNVASKESIVRTYDHEVKGNTVIKPLQGKYAGPNDAAVLKPLNDSWKGIAISSGMNPSYGKIDTYWMAASAVDEAIRNNLAVGGGRIALLDNFTWGNPERSERLGSLVRACEACYDFAVAYKTPFISGKDSLYNESPLGPVTPTLLITAVGILPDVRSAVTVDLKVSGNPIYIVGTTYDELGGSQYYKLRGFLGRNVPKVKTNRARKAFSLIRKSIILGHVKSCHDLSEGGLAVAAAEMALAGNCGLEFDLRKVPTEQSLERNDRLLFSESNSRFLVEVGAESRNCFEALAKDVACSRIGKVVRAPHLHIRGLTGKTIIDIPVKELSTNWKRTLKGDQA